MSEYTDINRRSRVLEGEVDFKLATFNKMCIDRKRKTANLSSVHGNSKCDNDHLIEATKLEIDGLLKQLGELNEQMLSIVGEDSPITIRHAVLRQGDLLRDYNSEYRKICENFQHSKNRDELLAIRKFSYPQCQKFSAERETKLLQSSDSLLDHQLSIAIETKSQLLSQRRSIKNLHIRLRGVYHKFPVLNDLLGRIFAAKQRHFLAYVIVLGVIGVIVLPKYILRGYL